MFEQATLSTGPRAKRVWTTCLGVAGQMLVVTAMILAPMIWPEVLPQAKALVQIVGPPRAVPSPPPGATAVRPRTARTSSAPALPWRPILQPASVPRSIAMIDEAPQADFSGVVGSIPGAMIGDGPGVPGAIPFFGIPAAPPPPIPKPVAAPPPKPDVPARIVKTSQLDSARILRRVEPKYPEMAIRMRVSGTVELRGIIGTDGRIRELKVLRGHPLLVQAAIEAVSQWIYEPTRLSGVPVEVDAPIIVTFRLN